MIVPSAAHSGIRACLSRSTTYLWQIVQFVNGSQLAKMKKSIPDMSLP